MCKEDLNELKNLEQKIDTEIGSMGILTFPLRAHLVGMYSVLSSKANGNLRLGSPADIESAQAICSRLSYLFGLFCSGDVEAIGENAKDCLDALSSYDTDGSSRQQLLAYAHFCELMPEVHRGVYNIKKDHNIFTLTHKFPKFPIYEKTDIILGDLSKPFSISHRSCGLIFNKIFDDLAIKAPNLDNASSKIDIILMKFYKHYLTTTVEFPVLTEEGFNTSLGVSKIEFWKFRAAWYAYAEFCNELSLGLQRQIKSCKKRKKLDRLATELFEWDSVFLKTGYLLDVISRLSGLKTSIIEKLMEPFSVVAINGRKIDDAVKDGYLPPFLIIRNSTMFNPTTLKLMLHARNLLFVQNIRDKARFDSDISTHMEPALLEFAIATLSLCPDIEIKKNIKWKDSEIDLLVYRREENFALHIQAKAAIPPQGQRMIQALEGRVKEGIDQLNKFQQLEQNGKDEIFSSALGFEVKNVQTCDGILSRQHFGSEKTYSAMKDILFLNTYNIIETSNFLLKGGKLRDLKGHLNAITEEILTESKSTWEEAQISLCGYIFKFPILKYDNKYIEKRRLDAISFLKKADSDFGIKMWAS